MATEAGVLYYAKAAAAWEPAAGHLGLALREGELIAVTSEAKKSNGWLEGFAVKANSHEALPFPEGYVSLVRVSPAPPAAEEQEASPPRSPALAAGPGPGPAAGEAAPPPAEQPGGAPEVDTSAHDIGFEHHLAAFQQTLAADRPFGFTGGSPRAAEEEVPKEEPDSPAAPDSPAPAAGSGDGGGAGAAAAAAPAPASDSASFETGSGLNGMEADQAQEAEALRNEEEAVRQREEHLAAEATRAKQERAQREEAHLRESERASAAWRAQRDAAKAAAKDEEDTAAATMAQARDEAAVVQAELEQVRLAHARVAEQEQAQAQELGHEEARGADLAEQHEELPELQALAEDEDGQKEQELPQPYATSPQPQEEPREEEGSPVRAASSAGQELLSRVTEFLDTTADRIDGLWETAVGSLYEVAPAAADGTMGIYFRSETDTHMRAGQLMYSRLERAVVAHMNDHEEEFHASVSYDDEDGVLCMRWSDGDEWWQVSADAVALPMPVPVEEPAKLRPVSPDPRTARAEANKKSSAAAPRELAHMGVYQLSHESCVQREHAAQLHQIQAVMHSKHRLHGHSIADSHAVFAAIDHDNSGTLDFDEFGEAMHRLGLGLTQQQVDSLVQALDRNGDGSIDYAELLSFLHGEMDPVGGFEEAAFSPESAEQEESSPVAVSPVPQQPQSPHAQVSPRSPPPSESLVVATSLGEPPLPVQTTDTVLALHAEATASKHTHRDSLGLPEPTPARAPTQASRDEMLKRLAAPRQVRSEIVEPQFDAASPFAWCNKCSNREAKSKGLELWKRVESIDEKVSVIIEKIGGVQSTGGGGDGGGDINTAAVGGLKAQMLPLQDERDECLHENERLQKQCRKQVANIQHRKAKRDQWEQDRKNRLAEGRIEQKNREQDEVKQFKSQREIFKHVAGAPSVSSQKGKYGEGSTYKPGERARQKIKYQAICEIAIRDAKDRRSTKVGMLQPGECFYVVQEESDFWLRIVQDGSKGGWISKRSATRQGHLPAKPLCVEQSTAQSLGAAVRRLPGADLATFAGMSVGKLLGKLEMLEAQPDAEINTEPSLIFVESGTIAAGEDEEGKLPLRGAWFYLQSANAKLTAVDSIVGLRITLDAIRKVEESAKREAAILDLLSQHERRKMPELGEAKFAIGTKGSRQGREKMLSLANERQMKKMVFKDGQTIVEAGKSGSIFYVVAGAVKVEGGCKKDKDGRKDRTIRERNWFGWGVNREGQGTSPRVVAVGELCQCWELKQIDISTATQSAGTGHRQAAADASTGRRQSKSGSMAERTEEFVKKKEQKLEKQRKERDQKDYKSLTFTPQFNKRPVKGAIRRPEKGNYGDSKHYNPGVRTRNEHQTETSFGAAPFVGAKSLYDAGTANCFAETQGEAIRRLSHGLHSPPRESRPETKTPRFVPQKKAGGGTTTAFIISAQPEAVVSHAPSSADRQKVNRFPTKDAKSKVGWKDVQQAMETKEARLKHEREKKHMAEMSLPVPSHKDLPGVKKTYSDAQSNYSPAKLKQPKHAAGESPPSTDVDVTVDTTLSDQPASSQIAAEPANAEAVPSVVKIPRPGTYKLCARAAATETFDGTEMCHLYDEAGEEIEIDEVRMLPDRRCRGHGPHGWVSFKNQKGEALLESLTGKDDDEPIGFGLTPRLWRDFCNDNGITTGVAVETSLITKACRELLPGAQPSALGPAYYSVDGDIDRSTLERLLVHYVYLSERWPDLEELREDHGDTLSLDNFKRCCRTLSYPISDQEAAEEFGHLQLDLGLEDGVMKFAYDGHPKSVCFHSWIARRATIETTLEPYDDDDDGEASPPPTHADQQQQIGHDEPDEPSIAERAMHIHEALQVGSTAIGNVTAAPAPTPAPAPAPTHPRMPPLPAAALRGKEPERSESLFDTNAAEPPLFNIVHGAALQGRSLYRVNKQKAEDSTENSGAFDTCSADIDISGGSLDELYLAAQAEPRDSLMGDSLVDLHAQFVGTGVNQSTDSAASVEEAKASQREFLSSAEPLSPRSAEKGGATSYRLLVEAGELVSAKRVLTVSGTACRSIADLSIHLRSKLEIPPEIEFAVFTDDVGDEVTSIDSFSPSQRIKLRRMVS